MRYFQQALYVVLLGVPPLIALSRHISREMPQRNFLIWGGTIIRNVCGCFAILLLAINAFGQKAPPSSTASNSDLQKVDEFRILFEEREALLGQKKELDDRVWDLWDKIKNLPGSDILERNLNQAKQDLERAQKASRPKEYLDSVQRYIDTIANNLEVVRSFTPQYDSAKNELEKKGRRLFAVEQRIASLYDASRDLNHFRTNVTITFGILVFFVIIGFYTIAWKKKGVATTIFSGEMGMQFVTLFLIVIAIILFGIMGTLEGRELAALLGGLSGYILGRATSRGVGDEHQTEQNKPRNPPTNNANDGSDGDTQTIEKDG
jgi:hypothetical protein